MCGNLITEPPTERCPSCKTLLPRFIPITRIIDEPRTPHQDPIKQKEAEMAKLFRHILETELPKYEWIPPPDRSLTQEELDSFSINDMIGEINGRFQDRPTDFGLKIVLLGSEASGKTEILQRFTPNTFSPEYKQSLGASFAVKDLEVQNRKVKLIIWDVAGQPSFRQLRRHCYSGSHGALLAFNVTDPSTFMELHTWITDYRRIAPKSTIILVGTHLDPTKQRLVPPEAAHMIDQRWNTPYYEIDSSMRNVTKAFNHITAHAIDRALAQIAQRTN